MQCAACNKATAVVRRSSSRLPYCKQCFTYAFEEEIYQVVEDNKLIVDGDVVCIGVSGGKDSSVLAHVLATLKERYHRNWILHLLAADEGIRGYRDDSLNIVLNMQNPNYNGLKILNFKERFGFTMDEVVDLIGQKSNCTVCGTFRRQILEIGARLLGANKLCTGHNIDDNAETALLNICRNDLFKLATNINECKNTTWPSTSTHKGGQCQQHTHDSTDSVKTDVEAYTQSIGIQCNSDDASSLHAPACLLPSAQSTDVNATAESREQDPYTCNYQDGKTHPPVSIDRVDVTNCDNGVSRHRPMEHTNGDSGGAVLKRIKPMMYCFEKEIVMYARYKNLEYFSTECIYAPEAYRGYMRTFIKQLETVDPRIIENITHSSQHFYADYPVGRNMKRCQKCGIEGINDMCKACITVDKLCRLKVDGGSDSKGTAKCLYAKDNLQ